MSRAYCDREHPGDDAEADRWCATYHRPAQPRQARCGDCGLPYDVPSDDGCPKHPRATPKAPTHLDSGPRDPSPLCGASGMLADVSSDINDADCADCQRTHEALTAEEA